MYVFGKVLEFALINALLVSVVSAKISLHAPKPDMDN